MDESEKLTVREHLKRYGIRRFESEEYWEWGAEQLGVKLAAKVDQYREPISESRATKAQQRRFYELIAAPKVASVVHSMKADAISATGEAIHAEIGGRSSILDLGCSIGYLTTFYGAADTRRAVIGWDVSKRAIQTAKRYTDHLGIQNVTFECRDITCDAPEQQFAAICSSQVLGHFGENLPIALEHIDRALANDGILVCVEALGTADDAQRFMAKVAEVGLSLRNFSFAHFWDIGQPGAYPVMSFSRIGATLDIDLVSEYEAALLAMAEQRGRGGDSNQRANNHHSVSQV